MEKPVPSALSLCLSTNAGGDGLLRTVTESVLTSTLLLHWEHAAPYPAPPLYLIVHKIVTESDPDALLLSLSLGRVSPAVR